MNTGEQMKRIIIIALALVSGCASRSALETCPQYFQDNIGQIKRQPLHPLSIFFNGVVNMENPEGTIHLYLLADKKTLLEEAFHSFEIRAMHNRPKEWERFCNAFHGDGSTFDGSNSTFDGSYGGFPLVATIMAVPFAAHVPGGKGYVSLYSKINHFEDTASCFVAKDKQYKDKVLMDKISAVRNFTQGKYKE
jgi:hypothetical protein